MKFAITKSTKSLLVSLDTESGKYAARVTTFNDPNVILGNNDICLLENGRPLIYLKPHEIGLIDGVAATNLGDAVAKINVLIDSITASAGLKFKGSVVPTDVPTGTDDALWVATQAGTYTFFGNFELPANSRAEISRVGGAFTNSITSFVIPAATNKIAPFINQAYTTLETQVSSLGKIWYNNAATAIGDIPGSSTKWVELLSAYNINNVEGGGFVIKDDLGNVVFFITDTGEVIFDFSDYQKAQIKSLQTVKETTGKEFIVKDELNNIGFSISENGELDFNSLGFVASAFIKKLVASSIPTPIVTPTASTAKQPTKISFDFADINHIVNYGQSLSVGQTEVVVSTEASYGNIITFGGSVLTSGYSENYPANLSTFTPLFERTYTPIASLKETPTTGICEKFYNDIVASKFTYRKGLKVLGSAPGQGATTISQLSKGTSYYARVIADVTAGKNNSIALGKTYKCYAVTWTQGESDYISNTTQATYKTLLKQLSIDLNADIKAITGQSEDIRFVMYQTATINSYSATPTIALAQYELAIADDNIIEMATAMYFMDYNDNFHLKAAYSKLMGVYYGKVLSSDKKFKPVYPIGHLIRTNNIELTFNVPEKPLVFQSITTSSTITNQGFEVIKAGVNILTSVVLMSDGISVRLVCSESPVGSEIRYGFQKATTAANIRNMGFMRDSEGLYNKHKISGVDYDLNNWTPVFNYNI